MMDSYHAIMIFIFFLASNLFSSGLVRRGVISGVAQRRFWNWLLLVFFLASGLLGLLLAILLDYKIFLSWYRGLLWWHVESGLAAAALAFCHIFWHRQYYWPKKILAGQEK